MRTLTTRGMKVDIPTVRQWLQRDAKDLEAWKTAGGMMGGQQGQMGQDMMEQKGQMMEQGKQMMQHEGMMGHEQMDNHWKGAFRHGK